MDLPHHVVIFYLVLVFYPDIPIRMADVWRKLHGRRLAQILLILKRFLYEASFKN
jgi:hypothetical protein